MVIHEIFKKSIFYYIMKEVKLAKYNSIHNTEVKSYVASLEAKYGDMVRIDENVVVSEDVMIGKYTYVNKNSSLENCTIGKYCSISDGVVISPWEHNLSLKSTHPIFYDEATQKRKRPRVVIGNDVLISHGVTILEGVKIGDGAVIGACALVTKDVQPYEIVGGVPAKHIKYRFSTQTISKLMEERWWDNE